MRLRRSDPIGVSGGFVARNLFSGLQMMPQATVPVACGQMLRSQLQPLVPPQVLHFMQVPLRTSV